MSAFSATFSDFCAGNTGLPQLLTALREDLLRNRQALFDDSALIDSAWRSGRVDHEVYQALRDTITNFDLSTPQAAPSRGDDWPVIRATKHDQVFDADHTAPDEDETTRFRSSLRTSPPQRVTRPSAPYPSSPANLWPSGGPALSDAPADDVRPGMTLKARFVLEEIIGRGGMGTVYRARDIRREEAQDRHPFVAVKVLNEDFRRHPEALKALQREAKKSQSLAHPNVASVYDFDRDGAIVFLVMELLEGESLQEMIQNRAGRGLPRAEVWRILRSVGAALAYAHEKGVVHSDFKPANVIRVRDGAIKVLDFGIARAIALPTGANVDTTRFNVSALRALTPAYASSEMLIGEQAHPADDVFALACVTYELLTGRHPFGHVSALMAERRRMEPIPIAGLDRGSWRALVHGLAFARADRTQSVEQFLAELAPRRFRGIAVSAIAATLVAAAVGAWLYVPAVRDFEPKALLDLLARAREQVVGAPAPPSVQAPEPAPAQSAESIPVQSAESAPPQSIEPAPSPSPDDSADAARQADASAYGEKLAEALGPLAEREALDIPSGWGTNAPGASTEAPVAEEALPTQPSGPSSNEEPEAGVGAAQASVRADAAPAPPASVASAPKVRAEFSLDQMKRRVLAFARMDEIPDALQALRDVEARLDADDLFLLQDAPRAIAQAYSRLGEREFVAGNYPAALALLDRASEKTPELPIYSERRTQIARVAELETALAQETPPPLDDVRVLLTQIRADEGPQYYEIRNRFAEALAQRVRMLRRSEPERARAWLEFAQQAFPGAAAIEALGDEAAVDDESSDSSAVDESVPSRQP